MNELSVILTLIAGLLLRFGIPLGITALLVYALRRLDQKWQREVELAAQPELVQVSLFDKIRCWATNECSQEISVTCPAFIESGRPCWQVHRDVSGEMQARCLECPVFQAAPVPRPI
ncbi:MAG: hypothetical protein GQ524_04175 [Anaerolineales bacterium]|nr:hypothetical protein [Anaerolineales bacterium]